MHIMLLMLRAAFGNLEGCPSPYARVGGYLRAPEGWSSACWDDCTFRWKPNITRKESWRHFLVPPKTENQREELTELKQERLCRTLTPENYRKRRSKKKRKTGCVLRAGLDENVVEQEVNWGTSSESSPPEIPSGSITVTSGDDSERSR